MLTGFRKEVINGYLRDDEVEEKFIKFMIKHNEKCKGSSWKAQNKRQIRVYPNGEWGMTAVDSTITMKHFLIKYSKKKISFKTIIYL